MQYQEKILKKLPPLESPWWLQGGNPQTLYAKLLQSPPSNYRRELLPDSTGTEKVAYDFVDGDNPDAPLVIHFHGLEGDSKSHYAIELMRHVQDRGWHGVVAHFRSCGGVPSTKLYHSGDSVEIEHMLSLMQQRYRTIYAVGVSLGGNVLAKYLGEKGRENITPIPKATAVVSAPLDLVNAGKALEYGLTKYIYTPYFFKSLLKKVPLRDDITVRSLGEFDEVYTVPIFGFKSKIEYYQQSSAKPFLQDITIPTLLINAQNDPFLPAKYLPTPADVSPQVYLLQPPHGGHVGFVSGKGRGHLRWLPETVLTFFEQFEPLNSQKPMKYSD